MQPGAVSSGPQLQAFVPSAYRACRSGELSPSGPMQTLAMLIVGSLHAWGLCSLG